MQKKKSSDAVKPATATATTNDPAAADGAAAISDFPSNPKRLTEPEYQLLKKFLAIFARRFPGRPAWIPKETLVAFLRHRADEEALALYELWLEDGSWSPWAKKYRYNLGVLPFYEVEIREDGRFRAARRRHADALIAQMPAELRELLNSMSSKKF